MGRRSRKRRDPERAPRPADVMRRGYARSEERNEQIRQSLEPLAPGERPGAVTVAAIVAVVLLVANVGLWLAGVDVSGREPTTGSVVLQGVVLLVAAVGMWKAKYWAVLGFQALLGITVTFSFLALLTASNARAAALCLAIIALCSPLFWFLVKTMARLQAPQRPTRRTGD